MIPIAAVVGELWYRPIAAIFLIGGLLILLWNVHLDEKYGANRPTKSEIGKMPLEEYRKNMKSPKFVAWVNNQTYSHFMGKFDSSGHQVAPPTTWQKIRSRFVGFLCR